MEEQNPTINVYCQEPDDRLDALWRMYDDNIMQSRQHETERTAIVGVIFTIGAALILSLIHI